MTNQNQFSKAARIIFVSAALVVVIAGMRAAAPLLVPFLLSIFIAVLCLPAINALEARGVHHLLALLLVMLLFVTISLLLVLMVGKSMDEFAYNMPLYETKIMHQWSKFYAWLIDNGINVSKETVLSQFDPRAGMEMTRAILSGFGNVLANSFLILLTVIFILLEAKSFTQKLRTFGKATDPAQTQVQFIDEFSVKVRSYMSIKSQMSLLTGVLVSMALWLLEVDYPILWGVLAFLFNFVPNIGSIIAAVPAVLLAFIQADATSAFIVAIAYIVINIGVGNVLEPRLMGKELGLSSLVVFLSLVFWGWVLGPVGMLLSVPLTVTVKLALDSKAETRAWGALLGHGN